MTSNTMETIRAEGAQGQGFRPLLYAVATVIYLFAGYLLARGGIGEAAIALVVFGTLFLAIGSYRCLTWIDPARRQVRREHRLLWLPVSRSITAFEDYDAIYVRAWRHAAAASPGSQRTGKKSEFQCFLVSRGCLDKIKAYTEFIQEIRGRAAGGFGIPPHAFDRDCIRFPGLLVTSSPGDRKAVEAFARRLAEVTGLPFYSA